MIAAFCGHRQIQEPEEVKAWLNETVEQLILEGADRFYLGGYGRFDVLAAAVVNERKKQHPGIRSVLVLPYPDLTFDAGSYDETVYPPLENVPRRFAISKRNEYMVDRADVVVAYVIYSFGGACKTLSYAQRKKKRIVRYKPRSAASPSDPQCFGRAPLPGETGNES